MVVTGHALTVNIRCDRCGEHFVAGANWQLDADDYRADAAVRSALSGYFGHACNFIASEAMARLLDSETLCCETCKRPRPCECDREALALLRVWEREREQANS